MSDLSALPPIAVLGAGAWGTGLALHISRSGQVVHLWDKDVALTQALQRDRSRQSLFPDVPFPDALQVVTDFNEAVQGVQDVLIVVPSQAFRFVLEDLKPWLSPSMRIVWASKGLDPTTAHPFHLTVQDELGDCKMAVLSGPSFAAEVARDLPTAVVVASNDDSFAQDLVARLNQRAFRVYTSQDMVGVQLGGAVKNVIAIAAGVSDGLQYGANAKSALITRGLAEVMRLGVAMGAHERTFVGLSGMGDLVLTCTDNQSRNRRFGLALASGKDAKQIQEEIGQVVEGVHTVDQVLQLARQYHVDMPICEHVHRVLQGQLSPKEAVVSLLARAPKPE